MLVHGNRLLIRETIGAQLEQLEYLISRPYPKMVRTRPWRLRRLEAATPDRMTVSADTPQKDVIDLGRLDVNIPPDLQAIARTEQAAWQGKSNRYFPSRGIANLREIVAKHVSNLSEDYYDADDNCIITTGGLAGIHSVLLATVEEGDEVILMDPSYPRLINSIILAGATPKFVPFVFEPGKEWILDRGRLQKAITPNTRAMLLMSPSMPSGGYLTADDWSLVAQLCVQNDLLLIVDAAMERLVFDGREIIHPARWSGMSERTITVGSASKELRMIGWRVGWIVGPKDLIQDIETICLANGQTPVGIAQDAVAVALERSSVTMMDYVRELQSRRDYLISELDGIPIGIPAGGWSLLLRVSDFGLDGRAAAERLLDCGVSVMTIDQWGVSHGDQFVCLVFSNEPVNRLQGIGQKIRSALGQRGKVLTG
jgi:N-succinyldiaminopimelate aminotransferase